MSAGASAGRSGSGIKGLIGSLHGLAASIPDSVVALVLRIAVAVPFWRSGQTKVNGFEITDQTFFLFQYEYALPVIPYDWAAVLATIAEHALPVMLVVGLFTRFAAFGLLVMTAVIQFLVYPDAWPTHLLWAAPLLYLVARGGGWLSVDQHVVSKVVRV